MLKDVSKLLCLCYNHDTHSPNRGMSECEMPHEMARDEARHGAAFEGLLKRYFG